MCRRMVTNVTNPVLTAIAGCAVLLMFTAVAGCGGDAGGPGEWSQEKIISVGLINSLDPDDSEAFPNSFAEGAVPPDSERERYGRYRFEATSTKIDGESATISVRVEDLDGNFIGEEEWTAVRVNGEWKLKKALLPDAAR